MLTPEQKAIVLGIWVKGRKRRGEEMTLKDVLERIAFNWPSLNSAEMGEVATAYKRRSTMTNAHPSSPKRLPKHVIRCELGPRLYIENFSDTNAAKTFLDAVLKDEPVKWVTPEHLTAKGGVLIVKCDDLEDIMEFTPKKKDIWQMPENMTRQLQAFLRGKWDKKVEGEKPARATPRATPAKRLPPARRNADVVGMVTIQDMCSRNKWEPRKARAAMRGAKWETPKGGWLWPKKDAPGVEKKLKELMK